jgi:hypothetical protein
MVAQVVQVILHNSQLLVFIFRDTPNLSNSGRLRTIEKLLRQKVN